MRVEALSVQILELVVVDEDHLRLRHLNELACLRVLHYNSFGHVLIILVRAVLQHLELEFLHELLVLVQLGHLVLRVDVHSGQVLLVVKNGVLQLVLLLSSQFGSEVLLLSDVFAQKLLQGGAVVGKEFVELVLRRRVNVELVLVQVLHHRVNLLVDRRDAWQLRLLHVVD